MPSVLYFLHVLLRLLCRCCWQVQKRYNKSVTQLAFLVSILYTAIGVLRLGFLIRFLSHPVTTGFTSGAAVIIGMSQVGYVVRIQPLNRSRTYTGLTDYPFA
eukprot:GHUV01058688.1.p1 GENE.GHUV01058688.1~~GHUV01058688.1.p1  ORF type:complete len:102 (+),score=15.61 GHUV01058688.1:115-420(+)